MSGAHSSVRSPAAGDILDGKYRVEQVLGEGSMGVVVAAQHLRLDQRVAIKFLRAEALGQPALVERFLREGRAAAKVRSEHVARVIDVGEFASGAPYMVLEYLEGEDLARVLERHGPLSVLTAVDYILQACEALAEAHVAGIVHRDLKPANLFLARKANGLSLIKLLDFGISKTQPGPDSMNISCATLGVLGTPHYMSPEQTRSAVDLDARSDIWALGVTLFELLSGAVPFSGGDTAAIVSAIVSKQPARLSDLRTDVPVELAMVVQRCLEKKRDQRFPDTLRLVRALAPFAPGAAARSIPHISSVVGGSLETERPPPGDTHQGVVCPVKAARKLRLGTALEMPPADALAQNGILSKSAVETAPASSLAARDERVRGTMLSKRSQTRPALATLLATLVMIAGVVLWLRRPSTRDDAVRPATAITEAQKLSLPPTDMTHTLGAVAAKEVAPASGSVAIPAANPKIPQASASAELAAADGPAIPHSARKSTRSRAQAKAVLAPRAADTQRIPAK